MKMSKLILANWSNIPNREYDLSNLVFLTGETGVGKSTMLDAIQTLMTAAKNGIVKYNAGQDEVQNKKRNKEYRTIQGYFAGEDRFKFSRPQGGRSTIALTFKSSQNEEKFNFTALITGLVEFEETKGEKRPKLESLKFFIIKNCELVQEDLLDENGRLLSHDELAKILSNKYDKENVIHCPDKSDYLNTLYGNLWGKNKTTETYSTKAAKAFSNFIHARPVENINAFVRNEFLTAKNMKDEVSHLSEAIRSLDKLKKEAALIEEEIEILETLEKKTNTLIKKWHILGEENFIYAHYDVLKQKAKIELDEKKYNKIEREIKTFENRLKKLELNEKNLQDKKTQLLISQQSNDKIKELEVIDAKVLDARKKFNEKLSACRNITSKLEALSRDISSIFIHNNFYEQLCVIIADFKVTLEEFSSNSFNQYFFNNDIESEDMQYQVIEFRRLLDKVIDSFSIFIKSSSFKDEKKRLKESYENLIVELKKLKEKRDSLNKDILNLEETKFYCPSNIQDEVNDLKKLIPKANIHMLYEFVELVDNEWREAIEGYIAFNRFSLIVSNEYEKEAIDLVKQHNMNLKIIQGQKVLEELEFRGKALSENSIIKLLDISNEKAEAYLICTYADVLQIENSKELTKTRRGLTKDCKAASGNLLFTCELKDKRFIFGEDAQRRTLMDLKEELNLVEKTFQDKTLTYGKISLTMQTLNKLSDKEQLVNIEEIYNINDNYAKYKDAKALRETIDTSSFDEIKEQIKICEKQLEECKYEIKDLSEKIGANKRSISEKLRVESDNFKALEDKKNKLNINREIFALVYDKLVITTNIGFETYEKDILLSLDIKQNLNQPENLKVVLQEDFYSLSKYYDVKSVSHRTTLPNELSFDELLITKEHFLGLINFRDDLFSKLEKKNSSLSYIHKNEIEGADKRFKDIFLNDFCNTIYVNIKHGENSIDSLNEVLRKHKFGNETYKIRRLPADEELKRYEDYFKTIYETKKSLDEGSLFEEVAKQGYEDVTASLLELFLENEKHVQELLRISDYRNYNNYDIFQEIDGNAISLSRNGKNSGGQGETSYYIIRSINLQSALKPSVSYTNSLESIIIDESFLKSNEKRSKEILSYLNETLGFQIICAMPTKNVGTFYEIESTNYHFVQYKGKSNPLSELDYTTYVEFKKRNIDPTKKLFELEEQNLFEQALKKADEVYKKEG